MHCGCAARIDFGHVRAKESEAVDGRGECDLLRDVSALAARVEEIGTGRWLLCSRDGYAGAMKGVMLAALPTMTVVDITHSIARHDIASAALFLASASARYITGHVLTVDGGMAM